MAASKNHNDIEEPVGVNPTRISDPRLRREARRAFIWVGIVGLSALAVYMAQSLLVIFGGIVFAAMIDGGARLLERVLPVGRGIRISIVMLGAVAFLGWLIWFAGSSIAAEAAALPDIIEEQVTRALAWAHANGLEIEANSMQNIAGQVGSGVGTVTRALTGILGGITTALLIAVIGIYISLEPRLYERGVEWMISTNRREDTRETLALMASRLRHLLGGRLLGMVIEGIFTYVMLMFYGVPLAALLGLITGVLAFIPNIGAIISGVLMVTVGFTGGVDMGLYTIFVYFFVQTIDGWVLVPMIAKRTVDLAPALVLGWQLILGVLFGVLGLALADPMLAMIKVALEQRSKRQDEELKKMTDLPKPKSRSRAGSATKAT